MSKAARELLEQLQKAGVIRKKADPDALRAEIKAVRNMLDYVNRRWFQKIKNWLFG